MAQKFVYLLEHHIFERPTLVGVFSSLDRARQQVKKMAKKHSYTISQFPLNRELTTKKEHKGDRSSPLRWHYGTSSSDYLEVDDHGRVSEQGQRCSFNWPD